MATSSPSNQIIINSDNNSDRNEHRLIFDPPLANQRYTRVCDILQSRPDVTTLSDFGCANARFMCWLKNVPHLAAINLLDKDEHTMELGLYNNYNVSLIEAIFGRKKHSSVDLKIRAFVGDLNWLDDQVISDCITMIEVIEHLKPVDVERAVRAVFGYYQPSLVIITTPNREFNHLLRRDGESMFAFRHADHKFEWNRHEFTKWAHEVCLTYPYTVNFDGVGQLPGSDPYGFCTQIAIFQRISSQPDINMREYVKFQTIMDDLDLTRELPERPRLEDQKKLVRMTEYFLPGHAGGDTNMEDASCWDTDWSYDQNNVTNQPAM